MGLREQLAALFGNQAPGLGISPPQMRPRPQQPDSPLVAQIPQGSAVPQQLTQVPPQSQPDGPMTEEGLAMLLNQTPAPPQRRPQAPQQDQAGMDDLMMQLQNPEQGISQGQSANIDDDTRAKAIAWALRQQNDTGV